MARQLQQRMNKIYLGVLKGKFNKTLNINLLLWDIVVVSKIKDEPET